MENRRLNAWYTTIIMSKIKAYSYIQIIVTLQFNIIANLQHCLLQYVFSLNSYVPVISSC